MSDKSPWILSLGAATLVVLVAGLWASNRRSDEFERRMDKRLQALEERVANAERKPPASPRSAGGNEGLDERISRFANDSYDYFGEIRSDLYQANQVLGQLRSQMKRVTGALTKPGEPSGTWGLVPTGDEPTANALAAYRKAAEGFGIRVSDGRVEVRGFLNLSPDRSMPIEYFATRWPMAGHETLMHVVGDKDVRTAQTADALDGLETAVYKALVAAGFKPGTPSALIPGPDPKRPVWVEPKGDTVYVGVRYRNRGATHLARATDWVVDPDERAVLPEDAFRFTGGLRREDFQSGDEVLAAELSGVSISVYVEPSAFLEVRMEGARRNSYQYNFARIPRPETALVAKDGAVRLFVDLRDVRRGRVRVARAEKDGKPATFGKPPTLVVEKSAAPADEGEEKVPPPIRVEFAPAGDSDGGYACDAKALTEHDTARWSIEADVGGTAVAVGPEAAEPFWMDLVFSRAPIVPEGDGAIPLAPIEVPADAPKGTGEKPAGGR
jgi:hypothetical protein